MDRKKRALYNIRTELKNPTQHLASDGDYGDGEFGGAAAKKIFVDAVASRQAEFNIVVLQFAGRGTTCYVCPIKDAYFVAIQAGATCNTLDAQLHQRPGFEQEPPLGCDKVNGVSSIDLAKTTQFGVAYWNMVLAIEGPGLPGSLSAALQQPQTSDGDAVVRYALGGMRLQLQLFLSAHQDDPDPIALGNDVNGTNCPG